MHDNACHPLGHSSPSLFNGPSLHHPLLLELPMLENQLLHPFWGLLTFGLARLQDGLSLSYGLRAREIDTKLASISESVFLRYARIASWLAPRSANSRDQTFSRCLSSSCRVIKSTYSLATLILVIATTFTWQSMLKTLTSSSKASSQAR